MKNEEAVMREYKSGAKSGAEIAATLGIGRNRVWGVLKKHGISERDFAERNKAHPDSWEQEEVLIGTIIGDGCLFRSSKGSKRRLSLAHSLAQKEYFMAKYNALESLVQSPWFYRAKAIKEPENRITASSFNREQTFCTTNSMPSGIETERRSFLKAFCLEEDCAWRLSSLMMDTGLETHSRLR